MKILVGAVGVVAVFLAAGCSVHASHVIPVRETFEGIAATDQINPAFWLCWRPENEFGITSEQARSGKQSLRLVIDALPLFAHQRYPFQLKTAEIEPQPCMKDPKDPEALKQYLNDESERAELWETDGQLATFGDDTYYGFSMLIGRHPPQGDYTRMVIAQWKTRWKPVKHDPPFLSLRMTGGFLHITLGVTADPNPPAKVNPTDCKVLLAFEEAVPPNTHEKLPLNYPTQCESRLNYDENQGLPAPVDPRTHKTTLTIERDAYLPHPFDSDGKGIWIDLIFHIKGGPSGKVEVWANGVRVATATGWIGYYDTDKPGQEDQYFKFGPYRDPAGYGMVLYLDNLARGTSYTEVDPSRP